MRAGWPIADARRRYIILDPCGQPLAGFQDAEMERCPVRTAAPDKDLEPQCGLPIWHRSPHTFRVVLRPRVRVKVDGHTFVHLTTTPDGITTECATVYPRGLGEGPTICPCGQFEVVEWM